MAVPPHRYSRKRIHELSGLAGNFSSSWCVWFLNPVRDTTNPGVQISFLGLEEYHFEESTPNQAHFLVSRHSKVSGPQSLPSSILSPNPRVSPLAAHFSACDHPQTLQADQSTTFKK
jgi:hypothetical protein